MGSLFQQAFPIYVLRLSNGYVDLPSSPHCTIQHTSGKTSMSSDQSVLLYVRS